jgi:hypothetical protein
MKRFGLLCLVLVLALGSIGVGYAMWSDTISIDGTVSTGSVCLGIVPGTWAEINTCPASEFAAFPDRNWSNWIYAPGSESCPPNYTFGLVRPCTNKDVAYVTFVAMQADGTVIPNPEAPEAPIVEKLKVIVHNAYPHWYGRITFDFYNCGTIPLHFKPLVIDQSPFLLIEYNNGVEQLEPGVSHEVSFRIGVVQHRGYFANINDPSSYVVDDPGEEPLPMNAGRGGPNDPPALSFTIVITGVQWAGD